ncbi:MAG: cation-translocating P-type ATPase, partial [Spirochaetia bacterium]|nr:cation-translocating P-type ATPase [Spirochaetia bacterium]
IVSAVRMGRRIFDNIKKALAYIVSVHIPIAGLSLLPVLFKWPLILTPVHIVFLELIIDPACSVVFEAEPEEKNVMKHKPRGMGAKVFDWKSMGLAIIQGCVVLAVILAVFVMTGKTTASEGEARAMAFATLVISNLCLILTNLSWSRSIISVIKDPNKAMWWVVGGACAVLLAVLYVPLLRDLFRFNYLHLNDLAICVAAGLFSVSWFELIKVIYGRKATLQK